MPHWSIELGQRCTRLFGLTLSRLNSAGPYKGSACAKLMQNVLTPKTGLGQHVHSIQVSLRQARRLS